MKKYEFIEHTADVMVKAQGATLEEAFAHAAQAMFDIITGEAEIGDGEEVTLEVSSIDREGLLVKFLSELIVIHEVESFVLSKVTVTFGENFTLKATARGERFDAERHSDGTPVKGVSYHLMEIRDGADGETPYVVVLFDI